MKWRLGIRCAIWLRASCLIYYGCHILLFFVICSNQSTRVNENRSGKLEVTCSIKEPPILPCLPKSWVPNAWDQFLDTIPKFYHTFFSNTARSCILGIQHSWSSLNGGNSTTFWAQIMNWNIQITFISAEDCSQLFPDDQFSLNAIYILLPALHE